MDGVFEHTATGRVLTVLQAGWQKEAEVYGVTSLLKVLGASIQYIPSWLANCVSLSIPDQTARTFDSLKQHRAVLNTLKQNRATTI